MHDVVGFLFIIIFIKRNTEFFHQRVDTFQHGINVGVFFCGQGFVVLQAQQQCIETLVILEFCQFLFRRQSGFDRLSRFFYRRFDGGFTFRKQRNRFFTADTRISNRILRTTAGLAGIILLTGTGRITAVFFLPFAFTAFRVELLTAFLWCP